MALIFPLSVSDFADKLKIQSVEWKLQRYDELSGLGSGDVLAAQLAPARWVAKVTLATMYHGEAAQAQALIETLDPTASFFLYAPQLPYPQSDPDGSILGAAELTIQTVGGNNRSLRVEGFPAGYTLTVGDFLAFDYGSSPVRRAFHRICETVSASGGIGLTPLFEVRPHLRPGVTTGPVVTIIKPAAKVFIVPESFSPGTARAVVTEGMSFEVMQRP